MPNLCALLITKPKEPTLFTGTVFENVANGLAGTEMDTLPVDEKIKLVEEACKAAFAHEFIEKLPQVRPRLLGCVRKF
jgi:ABC-type multidrug transport system fused ATPase/permease subunit